MSVHHLKVVAVAAAIATFSAAGYAEDAADQANPDTKALLEYVKKLESRVDQLEAEKTWPLDQVRSASGSALESAVRSINLSGYMEVQANHNFRHGGGGDGSLRGDTLGFNRLHGSAADETSFSVQNIELLADKPLTTENSTGFRVRADFGEVSRFDNRDFNFTDPGHAFDVREGFMSWRASFPWWSMTNYVDLSIGKMDSPLGIETPDAIDTANNFGLVTRSVAHNAAMPITHTGLRIVFPWMECAKTSVYLVNGWDNVRDTGDGKTIIVSHEMGKYEMMNSSLTFNVSFGNEGSAYINGFSPDGNKTKLGEIIWRGELDADNTMALDAFWATTDHGRVTSTTPAFVTDTRNFHGVAGYLRHQWTRDSWVSLRGEFYADDGFAGTVRPNGTVTGTLRMWDASLAVGWDVAPDMTVAIEYRHDQAASDARPFLNHDLDDNINSQDTVTASFVYRF